jgi:predicted adenylyl cyclase CyaB
MVLSGTGKRMSLFEVEQKYKVNNPAAVRKRLKALKARRLAGGHEKNELWDLGTHVRKKGSVLRLRTFDGKGIFTLKGPRLKSKFKKRVEVETEVNPKAVKKMLELLGFRVVARYEKTRDEFKLGLAHVTLDHLKNVGWFVEIEAPASQIQNIAAKLGLKEREERSYLEMIYGNRSAWRNK